jgi:hypothetical protein
VVVDAEEKKNGTRLLSGVMEKCAQKKLKKSLTGPALLEMDGSALIRWDENRPSLADEEARIGLQDD